jgi:hypothetical protein
MTSPSEQPAGLILCGLDSSNPLAFLAALGTLRTISHALPHRKAKMAWEQRLVAWRPVLCLLGKPSPTRDAILTTLEKTLVADFNNHPLEFLTEDRTNVRQSIGMGNSSNTALDREAADWRSALWSDLAPEATSQLQTVRRDYFPGNIQGILAKTTKKDLERALFVTWDYADGLDNQSIHADPSEDRRYAYQWHMPSGDKTRKKRGGMLGANRLAIEAIPLFQSFAVGQKISTTGFTGLGKDDTRWTWPIWSCPLGVDEIASLLRLPEMQAPRLNTVELRARGIVAAFRCQRILVEKTPNFTPAVAVL